MAYGKLRLAPDTPCSSADVPMPILDSPSSNMQDSPVIEPYTPLGTPLGSPSARLGMSNILTDIVAHDLGGAYGKPIVPEDFLLCPADIMDEVNDFYFCHLQGLGRCEEVQTFRRFIIHATKRIYVYKMAGSTRFRRMLHALVCWWRKEKVIRTVAVVKKQLQQERIDFNFKYEYQAQFFHGTGRNGADVADTAMYKLSQLCMMIAFIIVLVEEDAHKYAGKKINDQRSSYSREVDLARRVLSNPPPEELHRLMKQSKDQRKNYRLALETQERDRSILIHPQWLLPDIPLPYLEFTDFFAKLFDENDTTFPVGLKFDLRSCYKSLLMEIDGNLQNCLDAVSVLRGFMLTVFLTLVGCFQQPVYEIMTAMVAGLLQKNYDVAHDGKNN